MDVPFPGADFHDHGWLFGLAYNLESITLLGRPTILINVAGWWSSVDSQNGCWALDDMADGETFPNLPLWQPDSRTQSDVCWGVYYPDHTNGGDTNVLDCFHSALGRCCSASGQVRARGPTLHPSSPLADA